MTAPELSARERDVVARFEAGEAAPESWPGYEAAEWRCETCAAMTADLTPAQAARHEAIEERVAAWLYAHSDDSQPDLLAVALLSEDGPLVDVMRGAADDALIVAAVNALPRLVAALRNVQSRIEDLERSAPDSAYRKVASLLRSDLYATIAAALTDGTPR